TEEPGTGTEEPAGPVALFAGSDFENFEAFEASLGDPLKYAVQSTDGGRDGSSALHISGTPTRNDYVFTATVGEGVDAEKLANPTAITFYLKGKVSGKSISLNVHLSDGSYKPFNLGTVTGETTEITVEAESQNSYTGSITLADWTKITLSLDDLKLNTTAGGDLFALKVGKTGVYDIYIDDIMIE
ncbi:MAG: fimbrillin family protein, partial [Porphyromonas sp.]|nr:fimbrillin family protein [Porphyromonas sp.]